MPGAHRAMPLPKWNTRLRIAHETRVIVDVFGVLPNWPMKAMMERHGLGEEEFS